MQRKRPLLASTGWAPPNMSDLPDWSRYARIGLDLETRDPNLKADGPGDIRGDGHIAGYAVALPEGGGRVRSIYLPVGHEGGGNLDPEQVHRYMQANLRQFRGELVGANISYDLGWLLRAGHTLHSDARIHDVLLADTMIDERHMSYSLNAVAGRHGIPSKREAVLRMYAAAWGVNPKSEMWRLPAEAVGPYGEYDAQVVLQILESQLPLIAAEGMTDVYNQECALLPALERVRQRGVRVDIDQLDRVEQSLVEEIGSSLAEIHSLTGRSLSAEDLTLAEPQVALIKGLGMQPSITEKTRRESVTNELLEHSGIPAAVALWRARKAQKLLGTFVTSTRHHLINGRIHSTYKQSRTSGQFGGEEGAQHGRMSSVRPNIQQAPARGELAKAWRKIYIPDEGAMWGCFDWKQQEPRIGADYAERIRYTSRKECMYSPEMREKAAAAERSARAAAEAYRNDPNTDNHQMFADLIGWEGKEGRDRAKNIYLGLGYGMGSGKLAKSLGLPYEVRTYRGRESSVAGPEAQAVLDEFESRAPHLKMMARVLTSLARRHGYIRTRCGRKCRFPRDPGGGYMFTHKALNVLIQTTAGQQARRATVELDRAGVDIYAIVHDEFDVPLRDIEPEARRVRDIMLDCANTGNVPHGVDIEIGESWGEVEKYPLSR